MINNGQDTVERRGILPLSRFRKQEEDRDRLEKDQFELKYGLVVDRDLFTLSDILNKRKFMYIIMEQYAR